MFFRRGQDEVIQRVEERIAAFAMVPVGASVARAHSACCVLVLTSAVRRADHGEGIQVLHYLVGQKYEARAHKLHSRAS